MSYGYDYPGQLTPGGSELLGDLPPQIVDVDPLAISLTLHTPEIDLVDKYIEPAAIAAPLSITPPTIYNEFTLISVPAAISSPLTVKKPSILGELAAGDPAPSYEFYRRTVLPIREITGNVLISFNKSYDAAADFFTFNTSEFDSGDTFQGDGSTVQEWDKFDYEEYGDYLKSFTYNYAQDALGSMVLGYADVALNNLAGFFSPYGDSPIAAQILPFRPIRLYTGYKQLAHQVFVGQTTRLPDTSREAATFHAMDWIASFSDVEITDGLTFLNVTIDEIFDYVLQNYGGLSPTQYTLDVGLNTLSFVHVAPDTKIGDLFRDLLNSEQGRIYQTYDGEIRFDNQTNRLLATPIIIREQYVYDEKEPEEGAVINRVKINSDVRTVQASQQIYPKLKPGSLTDYEDFSSIEIPASSFVEIFISFDDPITSYTHPTVGSGLMANSASDGSGSNQNANLSFSVEGEFTDTVKYKFTNSSGSPIYVTLLEIDGTPATVTQQIRIDYSDATSIGKYGEQLITLDNNYFTDAADAQAYAEQIVNEFKDAPSFREITLKGFPYLSVGHVVEYYDGLNYVIDSIVGRVSPTEGHEQDVRMRKVA